MNPINSKIVGIAEVANGIFMIVLGLTFLINVFYTVCHLLGFTMRNSVRPLILYLYDFLEIAILHNAQHDEG